MKKIVFASMMLMVLIIGSASVLALPNTAKARVLHASPDAPSVDVWVNSEPGIIDIEYMELTPYVEVPKGEYNFMVVPNGATEPVVIDATLKLRPFRDYTIVAVNYLDSIMPIVLEDNRLKVPPKQSKIRFVHASPDAPAVDIAIKGGPVIFENYSFAESSKYMMVAPGEYDLEVRVAGTDIVALDIPVIELKENTAYTAFAVGELADESLTAKLVEDRIRIN